ncbi:MalM family protein [Vibrio ziniensis]|uniref:Transcriptional regulator n=1 Tax=Vibrio ziniensis TaxID=2711221 RepID=A0A6G7CNR5_9VIBR|nr:MalM family protein [Vibrio ziniensis]QIH43720.1 transcriptional regulator [Vibrio ziniensis]
MKFRSLLLGSCIVLAGCQSAPIVEQTMKATGQNITTVAQLESVAVKIPSVTRVAVTEESQRLTNEMFNSPVVVFEIPANRGELALSITSEIKDSVFYPNVLIVNQNGETIESYDDTHFEYRKPRLNLGNRLVANLEFYPPNGYQSLYVIIYTKQEYLNGVTYVAHPGRVDAEGRGNYMPELKDIAIPHSLTGVVELEVSGPKFLSFLSSSATVATTTENAKMVNVPLPDTQEYYRLSIKKAVEAGDIPKALSLLDEAKALGVEGAQEVFVKAVNTK